MFKIAFISAISVLFLSSCSYSQGDIDAYNKIPNTFNTSSGSSESTCSISYLKENKYWLNYWGRIDEVKKLGFDITDEQSINTYSGALSYSNNIFKENVGGSKKKTCIIKFIREKGEDYSYEDISYILIGIQQGKDYNKEYSDNYYNKKEYSSDVFLTKISQSFCSNDIFSKYINTNPNKNIESSLSYLKDRFISKNNFSSIDIKYVEGGGCIAKETYLGKDYFFDISEEIGYLENAKNKYESIK